MMNPIQTFHTLQRFRRFNVDRRVLWRSLKGFARANLLGQDQIRFVEIFVTLACNARCAFCSNGLFSERKHSVSLERYLSVIDECAALNVPVICLIGGEPLLYGHLPALIRHIHQNGMLSAIATNGYLLTREKIASLAKSGLKVVSVSLLSLDADKHDRALQLEGAHERIMRARQYCEDYGIAFSFSTVVTHQDFLDGSFEKMVAFAERSRTPLSVNPIVPTGNALKLRARILADGDVRRLERVSRNSTYISTHLTNNYDGYGCPAGNSYLGISATGDIFPCFFFPVSLGNIHSISLREAWDKARRMPLFKRRHPLCYAGTSPEFIAEYLMPIFASGTVPMPVESHPKFDAGRQGLKDLALAGAPEK